jgi:hypothetical protein
VPLSPLPATQEVYDTALRVHGSNEYDAGYLPYSIVDGWEQLQKDFAYWRIDVLASALRRVRMTANGLPRTEICMRC